MSGWKFLGWTMEQWAIALARFTDWPASDFAELQRFRREWDRRGYPAPGEVVLHGVDLPKDWERLRTCVLPVEHQAMRRLFEL